MIKDSSLYLADRNNVGVQLDLQLAYGQFIAECGQRFSVHRATHLITDKAAKKSEKTGLAKLKHRSAEGFLHRLKRYNHLVQHNKQHRKKVLLSSFCFNDHILGFRP